MPISAGLPLLQTQITSAFSMGKGANPSSTATSISLAIASVVPLGIFPIAPVPIPLTPTGLSAGQNMINQAFSLGPGASIDTTSQLFSIGVSLIAPTAPPAGLSALQSQLKSAFSMDKGADPRTVSTQIATAIIQYYLAGGVV